MPSDRSRYPDDWEQIAERAKATAGFRCEGCGVAQGECGTQRSTLTVHHPDRDPGNRHARLTVLCSVCHLMIEPRARVVERVRSILQPGEALADAWLRDRFRVERPGQTALPVDEEDICLS